MKKASPFTLSDVLRRLLDHMAMSCDNYIDACLDNGVIFFSDAILIRAQQVASYAGVDTDVVFSGLRLEFSEPEAIQPPLQEILNILSKERRSTEQWNLFYITERMKNTEFLECLNSIGCVRLDQFIKHEPPIPSPHLEIEHGTIFSEDPDEPVDPLFFESPGKYYAQLIPEETITQTPKSWLFQ